MTTASPALEYGHGVRVTAEIGTHSRRLGGASDAHDLPVIPTLPVSATLAANEAMAARLHRGQPVLPLAFGEAGLPVHPALRAALAESATCNSYGPVAGHPALRAAAAGYWERRGLPTDPGSVTCGPGSKAVLFALMLAIGGGVAVPRPSWVSYAAQARVLGLRTHPVAVPAGHGGICDPAALDAAIGAASAAGRPIRSTIVTLPDNPTGRIPAPGTIRALCEVAEARGLIIICDEIYRDLIHDPATPVLSPAQVVPRRTVITTGLSKSLALGGWRIGVARMPDGPLGTRLRAALIGAASEIWSAPAAPVQHAAALAFTEPAEIRDRVSRSRRLHATVARAVADACTKAGLLVPPPQAAFYLYPDFGPWRAHLQSRHGVTTSSGLARLLVQGYGAVTLPGTATSAGKLPGRAGSGLPRAAAMNISLRGPESPSAPARSSAVSLWAVRLMPRSRAHGLSLISPGGRSAGDTASLSRAFSTPPTPAADPSSNSGHQMGDGLAGFCGHNPELFSAAACLQAGSGHGSHRAIPAC